MSDSQSVEVVRGAYEAFARGDVASVLSTLSPEVVWTEAEGFPYGGTYHGPEQVLQSVFAKLGTEWEPFEAAPREFIAGQDAVVVLGTYRGTYKATGKSFEAAFAHVWWLTGGKVTRFRQYTDTLLVHNTLS